MGDRAGAPDRARGRHRLPCGRVMSRRAERLLRRVIMPRGWPRLRHVSRLAARRALARRTRARFGVALSGGRWRMPDSLSSAVLRGEPIRRPALDERFLPPAEFVWGSFTAADGAILRWGHLPVRGARADCVMVGGFGEFIEKQVETVRDLARRGIAVWCLDWRGQGGSARPRHLPTRPRARRFDRDARDLADFAMMKLGSPKGTHNRPRLLVAHSMGAAIGLLCLRRHPRLFDAAILSSPMLGLRTGKLPPTLLRVITRPARAAGLGVCFIPAAGKWRADRVPSPERSRGSAAAEPSRLRQAWFSVDPA